MQAESNNSHMRQAFKIFRELKIYVVSAVKHTWSN